MYILLHPREYSGTYFTGISANQIHLSYTHIFCNVKRNKVPQTKQGSFTRLVGSWGIKLSARSHVSGVQRFTRMLKEIEAKCLDVYQNENASSKYLMPSVSAVSHYVSLCKIAFDCVYNMTFLNFAQVMYVILSPP